MGHKRNTYRVLVEKYEVLGIDENIRLKQILKERQQRAWAGFIWLRTGQMLESCEDSTSWCRTFEFHAISQLSARRKLPQVVPMLAKNVTSSLH
jgi:hypothetical protein